MNPCWAAAAAAAGGFITVGLFMGPMASLQRRRGPREINHQGRLLPAAGGLVFTLGTTAGYGLGHFLAPGGPGACFPGDGGPAVLLSLSAFSLWGLWDDAAGTGDTRGWRGHLAAAGGGRWSTGGFKFLGMGTASVAVAAVAGVPPVWVVPAALVIALSANSVNLMDLRPGRALKGLGALLLAAAALAPGMGTWPALLPLLAAVLAYAPWDLAGRVMMGDTGANALGAAAGLLLVMASLHRWPPLLLAWVAVLAALQWLAERRSLSRLIAGRPWLAALDALGREVGEDYSPAPRITEKRE